jgi:hypothetical protein
VVVYACNPSTWEAEAGGSQVQGQAKLHSKTLHLKKKIHAQKLETSKHAIKLQ